VTHSRSCVVSGGVNWLLRCAGRSTRSDIGLRQLTVSAALIYIDSGPDSSRYSARRQETGMKLPHGFDFLARDVIYTSRAYAMMPVRLSVTEVHWRIIANLGFKFRSHFIAHWPPCCWRAPYCLRANHLAPCSPVLESLIVSSYEHTILSRSIHSCSRTAEGR